MSRIEPTVGRSLHYFPHESHPEAGKTHAAILAGVNGDGTINLAVFSEHGVPYNRIGVRLVQDGEEAPECFGHAAWMPFQVGQAKAQQPQSDIAQSRLEQHVAMEQASRQHASLVANVNQLVYLYVNDGARITRTPHKIIKVWSDKLVNVESIDGKSFRTSVPCIEYGESAGDKSTYVILGEPIELADFDITQEAADHKAKIDEANGENPEYRPADAPEDVRE